MTLLKLGAIFQIPPESFLHPDEYANLETARQRVRHMPTVDPQKLGDLSEEEKQMIAAHWLKTNFYAWCPMDSVKNIKALPEIQEALKNIRMEE